MNCIWILLLLCCCNNGCGNGCGNGNRNGCGNGGRKEERRCECNSCQPTLPPRPLPRPPFAPQPGCGCSASEMSEEEA